MKQTTRNNIINTLLYVLGVPFALALLTFTISFVEGYRDAQIQAQIEMEAVPAHTLCPLRQEFYLSEELTSTEKRFLEPLLIGAVNQYNAAAHKKVVGFSQHSTECGIPVFVRTQGSLINKSVIENFKVTLYNTKESFTAGFYLGDYDGNNDLIKGEIYIFKDVFYNKETKEMAESWGATLAEYWQSVLLHEITHFFAFNYHNDWEGCLMDEEPEAMVLDLCDREKAVIKDYHTY